MLADLRRRLRNALGHREPGYQKLQARARTIAGISGDLRIEAFVARLAEFEGRDDQIEAIAGLVIHRPAREWSDMDVSQAAIGLAELALRFRQTEILARVQDREPM